MFRGVATGVDMSTSLFPEIDVQPKHKLLNFYTTAFSFSAMLEQARRDTHNLDTLITTRETSCMSWRDATSGIWAYTIVGHG